MNLPLILLATLIIANSGQTCLTSSEDYSAEVVLDNYNLLNLKNIAKENGEGYYLESQYGSNLITLIDQSEFPKGVSIRLQIPTKIVEIEKPSLKIVSTSATGSLKKDLLKRFNRWNVSCSENHALCEFEKGDLLLKTQSFSGDQEVTLEINKELQDCDLTCSGVCLETTSASKCIDSQTKSELNIILRYTNLSQSFEELLDSYRIVGSERLSITDIQPSTNPYINWQEAMRQELVYLTSKQVLELSRQEIEGIVSLTKRGQSGQNYRIIKDYSTNSWKYYDKTPNAILTSQRDCKAYSLIQEPESPQTNVNFIYLVPTVILIIGFVFLLSLIIIAKTLQNKKRKKEEHRKKSSLK